MITKEDEILDQSPEDLMKAQIKRHKEIAKLHLDKAAELQKKLDLIGGSTSKVKATPKSKAKAKSQPKTKAVSHSAIEIGKSETEDVLLRNPDRTYRNEEIIQVLKPEYLKDPTVRRVAINKMSQILNALMQQQRIRKYHASGKGNKYGITRSYLEKVSGLKGLFDTAPAQN